MNKDNLRIILEKIKEYHRIILFRHARPDGDCFGAAKGLQRILQLSFPDKEIILPVRDRAEALTFLGSEDPAIPDEMYADALGIVVDTATLDRIANPKYSLCRQLIKIDHHLEVCPYGNLSWVEEGCSSCCEMIVHFYNAFRQELKIDEQAALYLYTGMVTDSGRFRFSSVTGDTLRCAAILLDLGIHTENLYAQLYLEPISQLKFKAYIYENMHLTENGVAYFYIDRAMQETFGLSQEDCSACVDYLNAIRGAICWMVLIDNPKPESTIRVRLRSRFVAINALAERYRGGGHACACGATLHSREEIPQLLQDADALVKEYKETHDGWL